MKKFLFLFVFSFLFLGFFSYGFSAKTVLPSDRQAVSRQQKKTSQWFLTIFKSSKTISWSNCQKILPSKVSALQQKLTTLQQVENNISGIITYAETISYPTVTLLRYQKQLLDQKLYLISLSSCVSKNIKKPDFLLSSVVKNIQSELKKIQIYAKKQSASKK